MARREIRIGQIYQPTEATFLGTRTLVWTVTALYTGTDGLAYARLVNAADPTMTKTLGVDVLADPRRFTLRAE